MTTTWNRFYLCDSINLHKSVWFLFNNTARVCCSVTWHKSDVKKNGAKDHLYTTFTETIMSCSRLICFVNAPSNQQWKICPIMELNYDPLFKIRSHAVYLQNKFRNSLALSENLIVYEGMCHSHGLKHFRVYMKNMEWKYCYDIIEQSTCLSNVPEGSGI